MFKNILNHIYLLHHRDLEVSSSTKTSIKSCFLQIYFLFFWKNAEFHLLFCSLFLVIFQAWFLPWVTRLGTFGHYISVHYSSFSSAKFTENQPIFTNFFIYYYLPLTLHSNGQNGNPFHQIFPNFYSTRHCLFKPHGVGHSLYATGHFG